MHNHKVYSAITNMLPFLPWKNVLRELSWKVFFHLTHNIHKHLKHLGLQQLYNYGPEFALKAKMIVALSFVPESHMLDHIDVLSSDLSDELKLLPNWFEDNCVGRWKRRGNGRHPPLFPTRMWNQYRRTIAGEDRSNNHVEATHRKVYAELGSNHPVISRFTEGIRTVQRGRDAYYEQLISGKNPNQKLLKHIKAQSKHRKTIWLTGTTLICNIYEV